MSNIVLDTKGVIVNWGEVPHANVPIAQINRYKAILECVIYKDWFFEIIVTDLEGSADLRAFFFDEGNKWYTRRWRFSKYMTNSEIVQTAFKCIITGEEHETREKFLYKGKPIFGPHFDIEKLFELCQTDNHKDARS